MSYKPFYYVDPNNKAIVGEEGKPRFWQPQGPDDPAPDTNEMYKRITESSRIQMYVPPPALPQLPQAEIPNQVTFTFDEPIVKHAITQLLPLATVQQERPMVEVSEEWTLAQTFAYSVPDPWRHIMVNLQPHVENISRLLDEEKQYFGRYLPLNGDLFTAFRLVRPENVRVVIIGQDPYPQILQNGLPQAMGLAFSTRRGWSIPDSLKNIYKEMVSDLGYPSEPAHGDLSSWAEQGVLLLNKALTVRPNAPEQHLVYWEGFVKSVIKALPRQQIIFILWGAKAQDLTPHLPPTARIITGSHPSPRSAYRGFFGGKYFSRVNGILASMNELPINWASVYQWRYCSTAD